jgi:hypothetical protein
MTAYLYNSPSGVPGDITRPDETNVEPTQLVTPFPANFGLPMKYAVGSNGVTGVTPMVASDTASLFCGVLARAVPGISQSSVNEAVDTFQPNQSEINGLATRGYLSVFVQGGGIPVRGQQAYVCVTASAGHLAGQFEVGSNGGNNVALTGTVVGTVTWASDGVDSNGYGEIRIAQ